MARTTKYHSSEIKRKRKPSPFKLGKRGWFMPSDLVMYCSLLLCYIFVILSNTYSVDAKLTITGSGGYSSRRIHLDLSDGGYKGIVVKINKDVPEKDCPTILSNIKVRNSFEFVKFVYLPNEICSFCKRTSQLVWYMLSKFVRYNLAWVYVFITYQIFNNTLACPHCVNDMNATWFFILCIYLSSHRFLWSNQWYKDTTMLKQFFYQFSLFTRTSEFLCIKGTKLLHQLVWELLVYLESVLISNLSKEDVIVI